MSDPKFWVAVSFVLFFLLLGRKIWAALTAALDGRAAGIRRQLDEAAELRAEAERMLAAAEAERAAAAKEAEELLARARAEAARVVALDRIAAAEASAIAEVRNAAADIASAAARAVLAETIDAATDARLVDQSLADLPKALRAA
jgi:F-type H+-transporting ATPase subunit b